MFNFLQKIFGGDGKGWRKVSDLKPGLQIAVPSEKGEILWDEIISIKPVGKEQVYDIEVEGTHNFVGNDIFAHNTYVLKADALTANVPEEVLTADKKEANLSKLATYALSEEQKLAERVGADETAMVSLEARVDKLESGEVSSETGVPTLASSTSALASAFESFGAFIKNGIAQFNTLVFQRLVAATDSTGASSAGSVSILTGNVIAQVSNSLVLSSTKIFVTFNSQITGSWWVSDKTAGSFRVVLSEAQTTDVSFDYFLVQTEGQIATSTAATLPSETLPPPTDNPTSQSPSITPPTPTSTPTSETTATSTPDSGTSTPISSDVTPPVVTLKGDAAIQLTVGDTFTDPGATAADDVDGSIAPIVTGAVDTATVGLYTLTYSATDASGNIGTASRVVTVVTAPVAPAPEPPPAETPAPVS